MAQNKFIDIIHSPSRVKARSKIMAREDRELKTALVSYRRKIGLTQAAVAELLGISQQAVDKFERYDSDPKLSTLRRYANAVGVIIAHDVIQDKNEKLTLDWADSPNWQLPATAISQEIKFSRPNVRPSGAWSKAKKTDFTLIA